MKIKLNKFQKNIILIITNNLKNIYHLYLSNKNECK